ncbi:MAG: DUF4931 domain-containing protein [Proteobacteria bacterium]|nr:DUF4931 domain-containing protein [Pseudomonadota bacterium]MBU1058800.1 DUF4931 domain-containing protein [Pseudomonadota bacterium]
MNKDDIREIRINPIIPTESVLIATARNSRPRKKEPPFIFDRRPHVADCHFCQGNEEMTPPEILRLPAGGDWQIRVVKNLYPVFADERNLEELSFGVQQVIDGYGRHEVIIDHSRHGISIHEMSISHLTRLFGLYRDRMAQLYETDKNHRYVLVFKNFGPAAGGSIPHTHSQIIAMPIVPYNVEAEVANSRSYFQKKQRCVFCSLIDEATSYEATLYERNSGKIRRKINVGQYVVERSKHFIAIKPFASRFEWEVHILPLVHQHDYTAIDNETCRDLGQIMKRVMARLEWVLGGVQYNYFLHSAPRDARAEDLQESFHWHLEICPRTSIPNGFELGSGLAVNTVSPEKAARQLREAEIADPE